MVKALLGSKSKTTRRRLRPTGRKPGTARIATNNSKFGAFSNNIRSPMGPMLPNSQTFTYRMTICREVQIEAAQSSYQLGINLHRPIHNLSGTQTPSTPGGFLPMFHLYDRCLVTKAKMKCKVTNLGLSNVDGRLNNRVDSAHVLGVLLPTNNRPQAPIDADVYERLCDLPSAVVKTLGSPSGGHDSAIVSCTVDLEKYETAGPDEPGKWIFRSGADQIVFPVANAIALTGTPVYAVYIGLDRPVLANYAHCIMLEFTFDFTIRWQNLRSLPKSVGDLTPFTITNPPTLQSEQGETDGGILTELISTNSLRRS